MSNERQNKTTKGAIEKAFDNTEEFSYSGFITGDVRLSPSDLETNPVVNIFKTYYSVKYYPDNPKQKALWSGGVTNTGVYRGIFHDNEIQFPELCCVCLKPAYLYKVFEVHVGPTRGSTIKADLSKYGQKQKLIRAAWKERHWFAVPFCFLHKNDRIGFSKESREKFTIDFENSEYARQFGKLNELEVIRVPGYKGMLKVGGTLVFLFMLFPFFVALYNILQHGSIPFWVVMIFALAVAYFLMVFIFWLRDRKNK